MARRRGGWPLARLIAALVLAAGCGGPATVEPSLVDLAGRPVDPFAGAPGASVFLFVRTDCPISNRYAPTIIRLADRFAPSGVAFWLVYADDAEPDDEVARHVTAFGYPGHPVRAVRDPSGSLIRAVKPDVTPEAALLDDERRLRYRGRIDDRFVSFSEARPAPTESDLERAIEQVLAGEPVDVSTRPAVGCAIEDPA